MALTRVQATGKVFADSAPSVAITFATPPTVGNGIVVLLTYWGNVGAGAPTIADNRGNTHALVIQGNNALMPSQVAIYYCAAITASASPFTITLSATSGTPYFVASALEISGGGLGLQIDRTASGFAISNATVNTGTTSALTGVDVLLAAVCSINAANASIVVESVTPTWTEEYEDLSFSHAVGEGDSRVITGALGTVATCTWTLPSNQDWTAVIAAFKATAAVAPPGARVETFIWGPI